jgi:hypothetical protein
MTRIRSQLLCAAAMRCAIGHGYLEMHPSGGYVTFTQAGADLFA